MSQALSYPFRAPTLPIPPDVWWLFAVQALVVVIVIVMCAGDGNGVGDMVACFVLLVMMWQGMVTMVTRVMRVTMVTKVTDRYNLIY